MKNIVRFVLKSVGILVYLSLFAVFVMRLITGNGDPITPVIAIIAISGFSALFSLVTRQTEAVAALAIATTSEIELLIEMSQVSSLSERISQNEKLN